MALRPTLIFIDTLSSTPIVVAALPGCGRPAAILIKRGRSVYGQMCRHRRPDEVLTMWNMLGCYGFDWDDADALREVFMRLNANLFVALAISIAFTMPVGAASITEEWDSVKAPPAPVLKPVTVDPKTTALLMLDFMNQNCGKRDRCLAQVPAMKKLLETARAAKVPVVYSFIAEHHRCRCDHGPEAGRRRAVGDLRAEQVHPDRS